MRLSRFGSRQVIYATSRKHPVDRDRNSTDIWFILAFGVIFKSWLGIVIYGSNDGHSWDKFYSLTSIIRIFFGSGFFFVITTIAANVIGMVLFLLLMRHAPKLSTYIMAIALALLVILIPIYRFGYSIYFIAEGTADAIFVFYDFMATSFLLFNLITTLICIRHTRMSVLSDMVKKTFEVYFFFLRLIPLGTIFVLLWIFVIAFTAAAFNSAYLHKIVQYYALIAGYYLFTFIYSFANMTFSPAIAAWYWNESREDVPNICHYFNYIMRHHLGSISLSAFFPFTCLAAFITAFRQKIVRSSTNICAYFHLALRLILRENIDYSVIGTSIYGQNLYRSTRTIFYVLTRNCPLSLAYSSIISVITMMMVLFSLPIIKITMLLWVWQNGELYRNGVHDDAILIGGFLFILIIMSSAILLLNIASKVTLLCTLEENEDKSSQSKMEPTNPNEVI